MTEPLVSILIPNYNYARYLPECLDSVLSQTYNNIECVISDNASTDNSWEIIESYREKFKKRGYIFKTFHNEKNMGSSFNCRQCKDNSTGDYTYYLCSDDSIEPTLIERAMKIFARSDEIGLVIFNRNDMDENGTKKESIPFYNESCIIPGEAQAAVFMMAGVAVLSQCIYKKSKAKMITDLDKKVRFVGDWYLNFRMCMVSDVAYIKEPLYNYRQHGESEASVSIDSMLAIFEEFVMINDFVDIAKAFDKNAPVERYDKAVKKIGGIALRYSYSALRKSNIELARKYLMLSLVFDYDLINSEIYQLLNKAIFNDDYEGLEKLALFSERQVSYDPPEGYVKISI